MDEIIEKIKKIGSKNWIFDNKHPKKTIKLLMKKYATYYYEGRAQVSDADFEVLVETLKMIDKNDKFLSTPGWGYKIRYGKKHIYGKVDTVKYTFDYQTLASYFENKEVVVVPKFDGLNVVCYFKDGKFDKMLTRGNGFVGKNVSWAYKNFFSINEKANFAINCEAICVDTKNQNCRDYVASYLNKKQHYDDKICLMPFSYFNKTTQNYVSEIDNLNLECKTKVQYLVYKNLPTENELLNIFNKFKSIYQIDGLVITSIDKSKKMAFKYQN